MTKCLTLAAIVVGAMAWSAMESAQAARYVARCVATPTCRITCSSNRTAVACFARIMPNGRCFRRCIRAR
ncbi:MAG: hypothetical protein IT538_11810 [Variibacter sp.]|nr:hypothetical protein [Variibacter sp.]